MNCKMTVALSKNSAFFLNSLLREGFRIAFVVDQFDTLLAKTRGFDAANEESPRPGIELGLSAWQAEILTTILPRKVRSFFIAMFHDCTYFLCDAKRRSYLHRGHAIRTNQNTQ